MNVLERVNRWKRIFGAQEKADSRPNVVGFQSNLTWLQQTYERRIGFAQVLAKKLGPKWELAEAFYDQPARTAQNILDSAAALKQYLKVTTS